MLLRRSVLSGRRVQSQSKELLHRALITHVVDIHRNNISFGKPNQCARPPTLCPIRSFSSGSVNGVNEKVINGNVVVSKNRVEMIDKPFEYASSYDLEDTPYFEYISPDTLNSIKFRALISALQKQEYDHLTDLYKGVTSSSHFTAEELPHVQNAIAHYYNDYFVQNFTSRNIASVLYAFSLLQFHYESVEQRTALFSLFDRFNATEHMERYDVKCVLNFVIHGKIEFASLTKEQGDLFLKRIESIGDQLHQKDVSRLLYHFDRMGLKWHVFPLAVQNLLANNIMNSKEIYAKHAVSLFHNLSYLEFTMWNNSNNEFKKCLHNIIATFLTGRFSAKQTFHLFERMGHVGLVYGVLPHTVRDAVRQAVDVIVQDEDKFIDLIHGLGNVQFPPDELSQATQHRLKQLYLHSLGTIRSNDVPLVLYGLAKVGVQYYKLAPDMRSLLVKCTKEQLATGNQAEKANITASIAAIGVPWFYLSRAAKNHIQSTLLVSLPLMSDQAVVETVRGLDNMGLSLSELSDELKEELLSCVSKCCNRVNVEQLKDVIHGLGGLLCNKGASKLLGAVQDSIISALERHVTKGDLIEVPLIVSGLGRIGFQWSSFPTGLQETLWELLTQEVPESAPIRVTNLWLGLGLLQVKYTDLPVALKNLLLDKTQATIQQFPAFELRNLMRGLEMMGAKLSKTNYPISFINALYVALKRDVPSMNANQFNRFLSILGSLGVKIQPLPDGLKKAISTTFEKHSVPMAGLARNNVMETLKMLSSVAYPWSSLPHSHQGAVRDALKNQMNTDPLSATNVAILVAYFEAMSLKVVDSSVDPEFASLLAKMASAAMSELSATKQRVMQNRLNKMGLVEHE